MESVENNNREKKRHRITIICKKCHEENTKTHSAVSWGKGLKIPTTLCCFIGFSPGQCCSARPHHLTLLLSHRQRTDPDSAVSEVSTGQLMDSLTEPPSLYTSPLWLHTPTSFLINNIESAANSMKTCDICLQAGIQFNINRE